MILDITIKLIVVIAVAYAITMTASIIVRTLLILREGNGEIPSTHFFVLGIMWSIFIGYMWIL